MELMKGRLVGLLAKCEISLHFCKSGRKTGGLDQVTCTAPEVNIF